MQRQMTITKRQGQVCGREGIHRWLDGVLDFAANGEHLLVFRKPERRRSNDQNALAWLWFTCIAEETGSSKDDVHDHYCMKFLRRPIVFNGREEMSMRGDERPHHGRNEAVPGHGAGRRGERAGNHSSRP